MTSLMITPAEDEAAYAQIEAAVMETARGRWFLAEFARRNRHAETSSILAAIERLQESVAQRPASFALATEPTAKNDRLENEILDMARAIAAMQREIQAIGANGDSTTAHVSSADELDNVVHTTEQATTSILAAAERVQEFAWTLRENAGNADDCDLLDRCATDIYTACGFQDLTAQRIAKVVEVLRFVDQRLKALLTAHDLAEDFAADEMMIAENAEPAPAKTDDIWMSEAHQAEIDDTFSFFEPAAVVAEPTMVDADLLEMDEAQAVEFAPLPQKKRAAKASAMSGETKASASSGETKAGASGGETKAGASGAEDADIIAPAANHDPYESLSTQERLRAFR